MADDDYAADAFGKDLAESIRANEALLRGLRYEAGQKMLQAQDGVSEPPSPFELAAIKKLEQQLENDKLYAQARTMTRRPA
jgi:hypothetical protein